MRVEDQGVSLEDFKSKGKKLSAQANTTDAQVAEGVVGKENVVAYDSFSAAIIALKNKDVDGVVINGANAAAYEREFVGELVVAIRDLESDPLGLVFRKGDANVAAFNEGLKMIRDDGTLDQLVNRYWGVK